VALCCIAAVIYFAGRADGRLEVDKNLFKNYDLKQIDEVKLESKDGKVELKFNGSKWTVNEQFNADASMIEVLFATLQQSEPKRAVPSSLRDSVSKGLKQNGVKVSLLSSGNKEIGFYAGGNVQKTQGYFCLEGEEDTPYLMTIPGYRVYVSGIFELDQKNWKDKLVFGFNWRNFEKLEARFPENPQHGFNVALNDSYFGIEGLTAVDTAKLNDFLDDVSLLTADEFMDQSVFNNVPKPPAAMIITVKDIAQRAYTLELFSPTSTAGTKVAGLINETQWAFFDPERVENILKRRDFFAK
jgi:hypothetical protein